MKTEIIYRIEVNKRELWDLINVIDYIRGNPPTYIDDDGIKLPSYNEAELADLKALQQGLETLAKQ